MERSSVMAHPAKVEPEATLSEMIKQVLQLIQKDGALSKRQARFQSKVLISALIDIVIDWS